MKKLFSIFLLLAAYCLSIHAQTSNECDAVLLLGFNEYNIFTQDALNSAYAEMLTKTDAQLEEIANTYNRKEGVSGSYKLIGATWSQNKSNSEWRKKFNLARSDYQASGMLSTQFLQETSTKVVNQNTVDRWYQCKEAYFETLRSQNDENIPKSFATEIVGDKNETFSLVIHFKPNTQGENKSVTVKAISYGNLIPSMPKNIITGAEIAPYTGITQTFTRMDKDKLAYVTITLEGIGNLQVTLQPDKSSNSNLPVGTVIASTLTYAEFCESIDEPMIFKTSNTWAPADGRSVQGSKYGDLKGFVPDLRGLFLRGLNKFYPDNNGAGNVNAQQLDPSNNRAPGTDIQYNTTRIPDNVKTANITFNDIYVSNIQARNGGGDHQHLNKTREAVNGVGWCNYVETGEGGAGNNQYRFRLRNDVNVQTKRYSVSGGNSETRPNNAAVYYYIKIN